jgi:hypothetical protein
MFFPLLRRICVVASTVTVFAGSTAAIAASAGPREIGVIGGVAAPAAIPGQYIVMLKDSASSRTVPVAKLAESLSTRYNGVVGSAWEALRGFSVAMTEADARMLAAESTVDHITRDSVRLAPRQPERRSMAGDVSPAAAQTPVTWGLDRIDQHARPLDNNYAYDDSAGIGVRAYIISSGITLSHPDFAGRAAYGPNFSGDGGTSSDCLGVGTEIAGTIAGTSYGVAKSASVVGVRIFKGTTSQCGGIIHAPFSAILAAFNWAVTNAVRPAVIVYNVGDGCVDLMTGQPIACDPMDLQNERNAQAAATASGLSVVAAAGESNADRCALDGGVAPGTFYVGATTSNDTKAGFSNYGSCLIMWAPGDMVTTAGLSGSITTSGTHLAAAHVAGTVALFLGKPEFAGAGPSMIYNELISRRSTPNVLTGIGPGSPNLLLFTGPPGFYTVGESLSLVPAGGGLELFGANSSGRLQYRNASGGGAWTPWTQSMTSGWQSVNGEPNADGRLALAGLTPSGELWIREETTANSNVWSNWSRLSAAPGSVPIGRVVMAHNLSNRLQIVATTHQGQAYYRSQLAPGSRQWSAWTAFSFSGKLRAITAVRLGDGRIQVLAVDDAGQVWNTTQTTPTDTNWPAFVKLNGFGVASIAAARHANGNVELIGVDAGGGAWHRTQTGGAWSAWSRLNPSSPKTLSRVTAETGADGRIQLVGVDNLGNIWHSVQTSVNASTYTTWTQLDGKVRP